MEFPSDNSIRTQTNVSQRFVTVRAATPVTAVGVDALAIDARARLAFVNVCKEEEEEEEERKKKGQCQINVGKVERKVESTLTETRVVAGSEAFGAVAPKAADLIDASSVDTGRDETLVEI